MSILLGAVVLVLSFAVLARRPDSCVCDWCRHCPVRAGALRVSLPEETEAAMCPEMTPIPAPRPGDAA